jgi:hypothetical protein
MDQEADSANRRPENLVISMITILSINSRAKISRFSRIRGCAEKVFEGPADHRVHDGKSIIVEAGPGTDMPALFRAARFNQ